MRAEPARVLGRVAAAGAALTLVVLAISVWLRVNTAVDGAGGAHSALAASSEGVLRAVHRVAASGVGLAACAAAFFAWRTRPHSRGRWTALAVAFAAIALLAAVGRLTPGYRLAWVTVANVTASIVLATAFWRLREAHPGARRGTMPARGLAFAALGCVLLQSALGAAASAAALQRLGTLDPWHVGAGLVVLGAVVALVASARALAPRWRVAMAALATAQLVTGLRLAAVGEGAAALAGWVHALLAACLAIGVAAIAFRSFPSRDGSRTRP